MLKRTITYTDFNGDEVKEDFFFHLSKAELVELEVSHQGGLSVAMQKIIDSNDGKAVIAEFKHIVLMAYGQRSEDGKRFIKNQTLRDEFESSEAYSTLFFELVTDADAAATFMNGIIPTGLVEDVEKIPIANHVNQANPPVPTPRAMTMAEARALPLEEQATLTDRIISGEIKIVGEE